MDVVIVAVGALLHLALGRWISSPWMVPDLLLVSLGVALWRSSSSASLRPVIVTSLIAMCFTVRHPLQAAWGYLGVGWIMKTVMFRLDVSRRFLPRDPPSCVRPEQSLRDFSGPVLAIGLAEGLLLAIWLVVIGPTPRSPLVLAAMRWALTCGCGLLATGLTPHQLAPSHRRTE